MNESREKPFADVLLAELQQIAARRDYCPTGGYPFPPDVATAKWQAARDEAANVRQQFLRDAGVGKLADLTKKQQREARNLEEEALRAAHRALEAGEVPVGALVVCGSASCAHVNPHAGSRQKKASQTTNHAGAPRSTRRSRMPWPL